SLPVFAVLIAEPGFEHAGFLAGADNLDRDEHQQQEQRVTILQGNQDAQYQQPAEHVDRVSDFRIQTLGDKFFGLGSDRKRLPQLPAGGEQQHGGGNGDANSRQASAIPYPRTKQDHSDDDQHHAKLQREEGSDFSGTGDRVRHTQLFYESLADAVDKIGVGWSESGGAHGRRHLSAVINGMCDDVRQDIVLAAAPGFAAAVLIGGGRGQVGFGAGGQVFVPECW